ncbi:hypothetical protein TNCV_2672491 [Trichonephila clavipes]|nr:hypothetical protein TNCV_2672491 [Trichonephila clavipes]
MDIVHRSVLCVDRGVRTLSEGRRGVCFQQSRFQNRRGTCFASGMREEYTVSFGRLQCPIWAFLSPCTSNVLFGDPIAAILGLRHPNYAEIFQDDRVTYPGLKLFTISLGDIMDDCE